MSTIPAVTAPVTFAARTVQNVGHDFRYAVRTLLKSPGFAAVAVLTMALGIGAATVTFSIVYNVLVNPLPYKDVRRSVVFSIRGLTGVGGWKGRSNFFGPEFLAIREQNHVFEDLIGWQTVTVLHDDGQSTRVFRGAYITANTFDFLGVPPLVGRPVTREDGRDGAAAVFAMNYLLWQGEFGADPGLIGKTFVLNGQPRTLVGIMPPRFNAFAADLWLATGVSAAGVGLTPMGRLKPGIGVDAASADLDAIMHRFDKEHPGGNNPSEFAVVAQTFLDSLLGSFKRTLIALVAAVTLLLLIACTNVANLMLARATTREREIALRASIGATSGRLVRLLLVESLVLSAGAALAGSFLAYAGLKIVVAVLPSGAIPSETAIAINGPILALALGLSVATMLLCGLAPAYHLIGRDLQPRLAAGGKSAGGGAPHGRLRAGLVVAEVALSTILVIGAGLLMRGFLVLTEVDLGFNPRNILYVRPLFPSGYASAERKNDFTRELLQRISVLPGVIDAAESMLVPPLTYDWSDTIIPGKPHVERWETRFELCSAGYFRTLGIRLVRGTLFSDADVAARRFVTVVNESFARRYFANEDPLHRQVGFQVLDRPFLDAPHHASFEIVGVVADHKTWGADFGLNANGVPQWQSAPQAFIPYSVQGFSYRTFLARTSVAPDSLRTLVRDAVWAIDPQVGIAASGTIERSLSEFYRSPRFDLMALGAFAGIGLALVAFGVFSVMAYTVSLRTHEIGVRMALGARPFQILRMVLVSGLGLVGAGGVIGLGTGYAVSGVLADRLAGVPVTDPITLGSVVVLVIAVGLTACVLPARQATRVDPLVALRSE